MLKKSTNYINLTSIIILIYLALLPYGPKDSTKETVIHHSFYLENAYNHVKNLSQTPHHVGSSNHSKAKKYIIKQLQKLGLEVTTQKTNITNDRNTFVNVENIIARIKGSDTNAKSLLLMSHYDSALFSSHGAADAASGVAVILEGTRAFLRQNITPKNDIIILITDAEEIGLLGAKAFVKKHKWSNNIGAILNLEARGSSGDSYMFIETNHGNSKLFDAYNQAGLQYQASSSLAYSIYKLLSNDTDLTVFREDKNIPGYNFAFIDDHFNYHTSLDNTENLSLDSLAHQAHYLVPMLTYLSHINLNELQSENDVVYFQVPFYKTISYSFKSALIISLTTIIVFLIITYIGIKNHSLRIKQIFSGGLPLMKSTIFTALLSFTGLKFAYWLQPHYSEMLHGFTYNGYIYILLFSILAIAITIQFYKKYINSHTSAELMFLPILLWLIIAIITSFYITGAHYFILTAIFGIFALMINVITKRETGTITLLMFTPIALIFAPILVQLPVALGLMILPFSGVLLVLILSVFITSIQIRNNATINKWLLVTVVITTFGYALTNSSINQYRPKPNSLFYYQNQQQAYFFSYDNNSDEWNHDYLTENQLDNNALLEFKKEHISWGKIVSKTENRNIKIAEIDILINRSYSDKHVYKIALKPQRQLNKITISTNSELTIHKLSINNETIQNNKNTFIKGRVLSRIYHTDQQSFIIDIEIEPDQKLDLNITEISSDLLSSSQFAIKKRSPLFIAKPFINSDSIITKQRFNPEKHLTN